MRLHLESEDVFYAVLNHAGRFPTVESILDEALALHLENGGPSAPLCVAFPAYAADWVRHIAAQVRGARVEG